MTLVRWNPFREVGDWDRSIDRLFDGIFPHVLEKESRRRALGHPLSMSPKMAIHWSSAWNCPVSPKTGWISRLTMAF